MSLMLKKKGGKQFAPRFPAKRSGAPSSAQSSARPSVERQSQTPVPLPQPQSRPTETLTILDDEDTPEHTNDPSSRIVETAPHQLIVEQTEDAHSPAHTSTEEASTRNISAHTQNATLPPDKESLKRKTRNGVEGEGPQKRHHSSTSDSQRSPLQSVAVEPSQPIEDQAHSAESSAPARLSISEPTPSEPQYPELSQPPEESPPRTDATTNETSTIENATNVESSQPTAQVSTASQRHPLPGDTHNALEDPPGSEVTITGLGPAGGASGLGPAGDVGSGAAGGQSAQTSVIVPMALLNPDGTPGELVQQPPTGTKKKAPKRRRVQEAEGGDDVRVTVEMQLNRPRRPRRKQNGKNKDDARKRGETPDGAEDEEINEKEMKMSDLCKDLRIGQKFSRHDELRQRERERIMKAKLAKGNPELASMVNGGEGGIQEGDEEGAPAEGQSRGLTEQPVTVGGGVQMRIVDGQIVVDENSMQINRQALAQAAQGEIEEVEEHEFSRITNSGTYMKRERVQLWDMAANETFWKGIRMFGTDFEMIAKMFPNRSRRQIKLKFNKEEKDNPSKLDRILKGQSNPIELDEYEELSGVKLEEVADIEAERERVEAEQQAEEDRRIAELAEVERKKKAVIAQRKERVQRLLVTADSDDEAGDHGEYGDNGESGEKENRQNEEGNETAEQKKKYVWSKTARTPKGPKTKDGTARKPKKRRGGADETVEVLDDA